MTSSYVWHAKKWTHYWHMWHTKMTLRSYVTCSTLQDAAAHCKVALFIHTTCKSQHTATHCNMTHGCSTEWHDSFIRVTWFVDTCDTSPSDDTFMRVTWLIHVCDMTHGLRVTWHIHMCDMTHVWGRSISYTSILYDMTHSYKRHDALICVRVDMYDTSPHVYTCEHVSFICAT